MKTTVRLLCLCTITLGLGFLVSPTVNGRTRTLWDVGVGKVGDASKELALLKGDWAFIHAEEAGEKWDERMTKGRITIDGDSIIARKDPNDKNDKGEKGTIIINPGSKPKSFDLKPADKTVTLKFIYELDGDRLMLCYDESGKERPTEFKTKPGSNDRLFILKRLKSE